MLLAWAPGLIASVRDGAYGEPVCLLAINSSASSAG